FFFFFPSFLHFVPTPLLPLYLIFILLPSLCFHSSPNLFSPIARVLYCTVIVDLSFLLIYLISYSIEYTRSIP
ncbi:hypothetical protein F4703DRAFT_1842644, partial [Phycomyces blakesleeanus]